MQFTSIFGSPPSGPKVDLSLSCTWFSQSMRSDIPLLQGEASQSLATAPVPWHTVLLQMVEALWACASNEGSVRQRPHQSKRRMWQNQELNLCSCQSLSFVVIRHFRIALSILTDTQLVQCYVVTCIKPWLSNPWSENVSFHCSTGLFNNLLFPKR